MTSFDIQTGTGHGKQEATSTVKRDHEERRKFLHGFMSDVTRGLSATPKTLPCKYLYDSRGSQIFDQICDLPEYYPTRTEIGILNDRLPEIAKILGPNVQIVEYGSGSGIKTRMLLESLDAPTGCALVEISRSHLANCAREMQKEFPQLKVSAVCADYTRRVRLSQAPKGTRRKVIFFPGSTIGNFDPEQARGFLAAMAQTVGEDGALVIGVDLQKDRSILEPAYDDAAGVTAAFNLNLLTRINRDLNANFDVDAFQHRAVYNEKAGRVEMHLVSTTNQDVTVGDRTYAFLAGETIHTENSYKYTLPKFKKLAASAGWNVQHVWTDRKKLFSVQYLTLAD